jgi:hypothetical protein
VKKFPAAIPDKGRHSLNPAEPDGLINFTQARLDETRTGKRSFFEDFMLEHSLSGPRVSSMKPAFFF